MLKPLLVLFVLWQVCLGANLAAFEIEFVKKAVEDGNTCEGWRSELQSAYDEVAELVAATMRDLQVVSQKRPDKGHLKDYENWNRIDRNLMQFFGFSVDENKPNPNSGYLKDVLDVFKPMDKTFKGSKAELHYDVQYGKPAIACGDMGWKYIAPGDTDPNDPKRRKLKDIKERAAFKETGAWVWDFRYLWIKDRSTEKVPNLCKVEPETLAMTAQQADLLTICLNNDNEPEPVMDRSLLKKGVSMDDIADPGFTMCISITMLHELAHLFGAWGNPMADGWPNLAKERAGKFSSFLFLWFIDHQAVDAKGMLLYGEKKVDKDGYVWYKDTTQPSTDGVPNEAKKTYLFKKVANLATTHPNNKNTGPGKSVNTAEAYAYFALASLFSEFDWTKDGKAKEFVKN